MAAEITILQSLPLPLPRPISNVTGSSFGLSLQLICDTFAIYSSSICIIPNHIEFRVQFVVNTPNSMLYCIAHTYTYIQTYIHMYTIYRVHSTLFHFYANVNFQQSKSQTRPEKSSGWAACWKIVASMEIRRNHEAYHISHSTKNIVHCQRTSSKKWWRKIVGGWALQGKCSAETWCELSGSLGLVDRWDFSWTKCEKRNCKQQINLISVVSNLYIELLQTK